MTADLSDDTTFQRHLVQIWSANSRVAVACDREDKQRCRAAQVAKSEVICQEDNKAALSPHERVQREYDETIAHFGEERA